MANNSEDIIDSREIVERVEELESDIEGWRGDLLENEVSLTNVEDEYTECENQTSTLDEDKDADELASIENEMDSLEGDIQSIQRLIGTINDDINEAQEELDSLNSLVEAASGYNCDFHSGATLINNDYFEDYAKDLAYDIGNMDQAGNWPFSCIDWTAAADELKVDYACIDFDGNEFWIRCT